MTLRVLVPVCLCLCLRMATVALCVAVCLCHIELLLRVGSSRSAEARHCSRSVRHSQAIICIAHKGHVCVCFSCRLSAPAALASPCIRDAAARAVEAARSATLKRYAQWSWTRDDGVIEEFSDATNAAIEQAFVRYRESALSGRMHASACGGAGAGTAAGPHAAANVVVSKSPHRIILFITMKLVDVATQTLWPVHRITNAE